MNEIGEMDMVNM